MKQTLILALIAIFFLSCKYKQVSETGNSTENNRPKITLTDQKASKETIELYNKLTALQGKGIMLGHQDDLAYGHSWYNEPNRSDVHDVTGKYPAVIGWEIGHIEIDAEYNLDSVYFHNIKRYIKEAHNRGTINTISWHCDNIVTRNDSWDSGQNYVVKSILPEGENHKEYLLWLDRVADFILDLKDEKDNFIPVVFRMFHEQSGGWFWWGNQQCTPEEFKQLWIMTVQYLRDNCNVHNILYAFSPSEIRDIDHYLERYPGDEYVDIIGFDCYAYGENEVFSPEEMEKVIAKYQDALCHNLDIICSYASESGKIPAITETGVERIPYPGFFSEVLYPTIKDYRFSYILFWRNAYNKPSHYYLPYQGSNNEEDFRNFVAQPDILMAEDIQ